MAITLNGTTGVTTTGLTSNGIDDNATSTAMTLDSGGRVKIGTTSNTPAGDGVAGFVFGDNTAGTPAAGVASFAASSSAPLLLTRLTSDGNVLGIADATTTRGLLRVVSSNLAIQGNNNLVFSTGGSNTERMRINSSGHAIIPAGVTLGTSAGVYNAANTLDDYEEGTWTPTGNGITYSSAFGSYVKVGRLVMITFNVTFPSTSDANSARIESLPFTVTTGNAYQSGAYVTASDAGTIIDDTYFTISTSRLLIRNNGNGDRDNNQYSAKFIQGSAVYMTD